MMIPPLLAPIRGYQQSSSSLVLLAFLSDSRVTYRGCPKVNGVVFPFLSFLSLIIGLSSLTVSSSAGSLRNITLKAWPNSWPCSWRSIFSCNSLASLFWTIL